MKEQTEVFSDGEKDCGGLRPVKFRWEQQNHFLSFCLDIIYPTNRRWKKLIDEEVNL